MTDEMIKNIRHVAAELLLLSPEELHKKLEEHEPTDIYYTLLDLWGVEYEDE